MAVVLGLRLVAGPRHAAARRGSPGGEAGAHQPEPSAAEDAMVRLLGASFVAGGGLVLYLAAGQLLRGGAARGGEPRVARVPRTCYARPVSAGDLDLVFQALQAGGVRYLVVGGVAVVLHGHPRFTADLDLVVALEAANARAAVAALAGLGYRPRPPVDAALFADAAARQGWIAEKDLIVLSLWSPEHPATEVDLFVREPFPFEEASARATVIDLGGVHVPVASIEDLVAMKRAVGRPKDLEDARQLEAIAAERRRG